MQGYFGNVELYIRSGWSCSYSPPAAKIKFTKLSFISTARGKKKSIEEYRWKEDAERRWIWTWTGGDRSTADRSQKEGRWRRRLCPAWLTPCLLCYLPILDPTPDSYLPTIPDHQIMPGFGVFFFRNFSCVVGVVLVTIFALIKVVYFIICGKIIDV